MKKTLLSLSAVALAVASIPLFAAFEAHVINVTARIENALRVDTTPIKYGTVFPEEKLDKLVTVNLSGSFLEETRVDDVNYILRQKPKCGITSQNGQVLDELSTRSGEPRLGPVDVPFIFCGDPPRQLATNETWGPLPLLCPYLSKHPISGPNDPSQNDGSLNAFHEIGHWVGRQWVWNDVPGRLAKSENDRVDLWNLDLVVPCFKGSCAQDDVVPAEFEADPLDEHKIFGCDLWIEVTGVSRNPRGELSIKQSSAGEALAEWSTFVGQDGLLAHLKVLGTDGTNGDEARLVIQASDVGITTLDDLDTIKWDAFGVTGYAPHVDVIVDTNNDGIKDDALVFEYAKVNPLSCDNSGSYPTGDFDTFNEKGIVDSAAYAWLSSGPPGPCGDATFNANHMSLANWKLTGIAGISGSTRVLRLEIEVDNWIQSSEAYLDDVLVNGI